MCFYVLKWDFSQKMAILQGCFSQKMAKIRLKGLARCFKMCLGVCK